MLNVDFKQRVVIETVSMHWVASLSPTVLQKTLERAEQEGGHATHIVQYTEGTDLKPHPHPLAKNFWCSKGFSLMKQETLVPALTCVTHQEARMRSGAKRAALYWQSLINSILEIQLLCE